MTSAPHPVRVTVLVENTASPSGLAGEHGLSYWIECGSAHVLFDTGRSDRFARNAAALGIDLSQADAIVLSHGHYDHTGGLTDALALAPRARLFLHPAATQGRYSRHRDGSVWEVGMPVAAEAMVRRMPDRVVWTESVTEVAGPLHVTGPVPRAHNFEDTGGDFYLDFACTRPDPLRDDQALFFRCAPGLVILLGCAHAGVINTVRHIQAIAGAWPVHAVVGGMHLRSASDERITATLEALEECNVRLLAPGHCTGDAVQRRIQQRFPGRCADCRTGSQFDFA